MIAIGSQVVPNHDLYITPFTCGCIWRWWTGEVGPQNHRWEKQCIFHANQLKAEDCTCLNVGEDDGATTCWPHHDCSLGYCTHWDND